MTRLSIQRMISKIAERFPNDKQKAHAYRRLKKLVKSGKIDRQSMRKYIKNEGI